MPREGLSLPDTIDVRVADGQVGAIWNTERERAAM